MAFGLALTPSLVVALAALSGIGHRWIDLLAQFTGPALVIAVLALGAAALLRLRAALLGAVATSLLLLIAGSSQWAPPRGEPTRGGAAFTLYSANLHFENTDTAAMRRSIEASDADFVVLVEAGPGATAALDTLLVGYPHRLVRHQFVLAGRRPIRDLNLRVPFLHISAAEVETPLGPVTVAGLHMTRPWPFQIQWEQIRQAEGLSAWARTVDGPLVVAGDFNSVSSARIGRQIRDQGGLTPAPGWPGTWPAQLPAFATLTIDQVYRSPELAIVDRRLGLPTGSDHRPVITRFVTAAPEPGR